MKFIIIGTVGDGLAIAHRLSLEGNKVTYYNTDKQADEVGIGFGFKRVSKSKIELDKFIMSNRDAIFIFDGSEMGRKQELMRKAGMKVIGSSSFGTKIEQDRIYGCDVSKQLGIKTPETINVESVKEAVTYLKKNIDKKFVLKQTGDLPKTLNTIGESEAIIKHLYVMEKKLGDKLQGKLVIQDFIEGTEVAVCGLYAGDKWIKNKNGNTLIEVNYENKKFMEGDIGQSTGETGTVIKFMDNENMIFKKMVKPLESLLKEHNHFGQVDANCIYDGKDIWLLEHTLRNGYPVTDLYTELSNTDLGEFYSNWTDKKTVDFDIDKWGVVLAVTVPLFPNESSKSQMDSSKGNVIDITGLSEDDQDHLHLYEVNKEDLKEYKNEFTVAEDFGFIGTITEKDSDYFKANDKCLKIIDKIKVSNKQYRRDIAKVCEKRINDTKNIVT